MKTLKYITLILLCFSLNPISFGQGIPISPKDIPVIKSKPLIVSLIPNLLNSEKNDSINNEIRNYNEGIKQAINNNWFENNDISFKLPDEIAALREEGNSNFATISFSLFNRVYDNSQERLAVNNIRILNYYAFNGKKKIKYSFFIPDLGKNKTRYPSKNEIILSVKMMKNHINYIEEINKKLYDFKRYAKNQAEENCSSIGQDTLFINIFISNKDMSIEDYRESLKGNNVKLATKEEFAAKVINEEDVIIGIAVPKYLVVSPVSDELTRKTYYRLFVNAKTGKIMSYTFNNSEIFSYSDMISVAECK